MSRAAFFASAFAFVLSCKTTSTEGPTTPPPTADASDTAATPTETPADDVEPGAPGVPWQDKTFEQRKDFMGITFFPAMKKNFKGHDEAMFQGFKCQTCHGDDMKERNFEMPTDSIFPLSKENTMQQAMDYDEEMTKFMAEVVVPEAAKMLDQQPYNPETGEGTFGCFACHPTE